MTTLYVFKLRLELVVFVLVIILKKILNFSRTKQSFTRNPEVVNSVRQSVSKSFQKKKPSGLAEYTTFGGYLARELQKTPQIRANS